MTMRKRIQIGLAVLLMILVGVIAWQVLRLREPFIICRSRPDYKTPVRLLQARKCLSESRLAIGHQAPFGMPFP
jgi:hypothetical protein